jgi:hypothetical protein
MPADGPAGQRGGMNDNASSKVHRTAGQLSPPLTGMAAALFVAGVLVGWVDYLHRSPILAKHVPGTAAWWQQGIVAAVGCVLFGYARRRHVRRHGRGSGRLWLLAPLGRPAARRVARTMSGAPGRVLLMLAPAVAFGYSFYRAGLQIIDGLDPNATVNAWGGPTYLGAMAAHYLDCAVGALAAALLLDRILLPGPGGRGATAVTADGLVENRSLKKCCPLLGATLRLPTCPWASCRRSWREVPIVTDINFDGLTAVVLTAGVLTAEPWRARLGAFGPRPAFPGTGVLGVGGTGPSVAVRPVPRVRGKAALAIPAPQSAIAAQLGQTNNYNHMTSVYAVGEGASGPPPDREPV